MNHMWIISFKYVFIYEQIYINIYELFVYVYAFLQYELRL